MLVYITFALRMLESRFRTIPSGMDLFHRKLPSERDDHRESLQESRLLCAVLINTSQQVQMMLLLMNVFRRGFIFRFRNVD